MSRSVDELEELLGSAPWELFEARYTGDIFVRVDDGSGLLGFYMRIGTYLKRPVQVIMADGNYIRIRSADKYAQCGLLSLDPNKPDACLYPEHFQYESGIPSKPLWQPFVPYLAAAQVASSVPYGTFSGGTFTTVTTSTAGTFTGISPTYSNALQGLQNTQLQNVGLYTAGTQPTQSLGQLHSGWFSKLFGGITS